MAITLNSDYLQQITARLTNAAFAHLNDAESKLVDLDTTNNTFENALHAFTFNHAKNLGSVTVIWKELKAELNTIYEVEKPKTTNQELRRSLLEEIGSFYAENRRVSLARKFFSIINPITNEPVSLVALIHLSYAQVPGQTKPRMILIERILPLSVATYYPQAFSIAKKITTISFLLSELITKNRRVQFHTPLAMPTTREHHVAKKVRMDDAVQPVDEAPRNNDTTEPSRRKYSRELASLINGTLVQPAS